MGVKCSNHPEKVVAIAKVIPDLFQHKMSKDYFIPPGKVEFNPNDRSTYLSPPNSETVFKGKYNGSLVAIKLYPHPVPNLSNTNADCTKSNTLALLEMWQECQALQKIHSINCPYLVNLLGMCQSPLCLVFPFAKWSSLEDVIQDKEIYVPLMVRIRMLQQLTAALQSIHSQHMIHRHVCLANILVTSLSPDEKVNIKLAGFSEACHAMFQGISKGYHGTFPAPEMSEEQLRRESRYVCLCLCGERDHHTAQDSYQFQSVPPQSVVSPGETNSSSNCSTTAFALPVS